MKIPQCKHVVVPSTFTKYCTRGKNPNNSLPVPRKTGRDSTFLNTHPLSRISLQHIHNTELCHPSHKLQALRALGCGVFILLKSSATTSLPQKPKLLSSPCCPRWSVALIPLLGARADAAPGHCYPTLCAWCDLCAPL